MTRRITLVLVGLAIAVSGTALTLRSDAVWLVVLPWILVIALWVAIWNRHRNDGGTR